MRRMLLCLTAAALVCAPLLPAGFASAEPVSQYKQTSYRDGGVVLRMDTAKGSILNPGEEISFTFQTSDDAYVILFNIDTEGYVHLLHPFEGAPSAARARTTHRVPDDPRERLLVSGETGMEFVFALTVPDRSALDDDELDYLRTIDSRPLSERYRIDGDPFLAANIIAGELVRGISHRTGVFLDYTYFYVNERVDHPCYLCGECDGSSGSALCDDYDLVADFDRSSPLTYPLERAYTVVDRNAPDGDETDIGVAYEVEDEDDDGDRVNVTFYPYSAEVRYVTRPWVYSYDRYWYDPLWYDPWYCGYVYYPGWYYPYYGHYYTWGFSWGWWGGYYCSGWYYPRYHYWYDYYHYNYYDYASYRHVKYKSAFKQRSQTLQKNSLVALRDRTVKRNDRLKIASKDLTRSSRIAKGKSVGTALSDRRTVKRTGKSAVKTTRVKNRRSTTTIKSRSIKPRTRSTSTRVKSGTNKRRSTGTKARPTVKSRSSSRKSSGTIKPRSSTKSRSYKGKTSSKRSRSSVKPAPRQSSSSRKSGAVKRSTNSRPRSSSSSVKRSSSSSRSRSSARSSGSRSSGGSKSRSKRR